MKIKHDEAALRRSATNRLLRAQEAAQEHARRKNVRHIVVGLIIVLAVTAGILGMRLLF